ncbi:MAG: hypothetical protein JWQ23_1443, partial [Herminiimonas sp.]|nr:hypothetical protein [Herminiimonas sp.]
MQMWKSMFVPLALGLAFASSASAAQTGAENERRPMHSPGGDLVPADPEPETPPAARPYADPDPLPASGGPQPRTEAGTGDHSRVPLTTDSKPLPPPAAAPMPGPQPRSENGYTWLCGGVGADEANQK